MKKYFLNKKVTRELETDDSIVSTYREQVIKEMLNMGASSDEVSLLKFETILNSLRSHREPKDVAWAILQ